MDYTNSSYDLYEDFTNVTYIDAHNDYRSNKTIMIFVELILGALIVLSNGTIIAGTLLSRDIRNKSKNFLILVLCCVDFFSGAYNHPALAFFYHMRVTTNPENANGCGNAFIYYFTDISFACEQCICILMVSAIAIDWIIMTATKSYNPENRKSLALFMTAYIVLGSIVFVVSYFLPIVDFSYLCFLNYSNTLPVVLVVESPQLLFLALTTLFVFIGYIQAKSLTTSPSIPLDILMASIVTFLFILPTNIFMIIGFYFESVFYQLADWQYILIYRLPAVKRIFLPFVWLLDSKTRKELKRSLTCTKNSRAPITENIEIAEKR